MKLIRTIASVGIGAFCIERFIDEQSGWSNFLVVYDCGKGRSKNTSKPLKKIIDQDLRVYNKTVDFLFLSHFDSDHINGLSYLISQGIVNSTDTRVFLPLIQTPYIFLYEYINNLHFIDAVNLLKQHSIKVVFVNPDRNFVEEPMMIREEGSQEPEIISFADRIESYTRLNLPKSVKPLWKYVPFYLQNNGIYKAFLSYISHNNPYGITQRDFKNFLQWSESQKNWLRNRYKNFRYSKNRHSKEVSPINMNAMLLISDKSECANILRTSIQYTDFQGVSNTSNQLECSVLYTSDVGLNDQKYFNRVNFAIQNYIVGQRAGLFQIPHHASIHCYNSNTFRKLPFDMAFCNCKKSSINPSYCSQYENDAMQSGIPYAIVDDNPTNVLEEEILIR